MSTYLKKLRQDRRLSQAAAALQSGVSRQMWSEVERGRCLFSAANAERCGGWGPMLHEHHRSAVPAWRDRVGVRPYQLERVAPEPWQRCLKRWAWDFRELNPSLVSWMSSFLECDSALEALGWLQLATLHGSGLVASPHELGFRHQPIVDRQGQVLGERTLAALTGHRGDIRFIAWPQVRLRPGSVTYRADGLVLLHRRRQCRWFVLEFDGPLHSLARDAARQRELGLPEIRISQELVATFQVTQCLLEA